jgi:UTP-glucose-1-phosphate uridylyltransferase
MDFASDEMPHTGYLLPKILEKEIPIGAKVMDGEYFDCGTPSEYLAMLKRVTI